MASASPTLSVSRRRLQRRETSGTPTAMIVASAKPATSAKPGIKVNGFPIGKPLGSRHAEHLGLRCRNGLAPGES
jgi:hypothetical protein